MAATEKLKRLLQLIPMMHANPGIKIETLLQWSGYKNERSFSDDLNRLILLGVPPFSPGDYVDLYIDDDGRVFLDFPQGLERPLALSPEEWSTLARLIQSSMTLLDDQSPGQEELAAILEQISDVPVQFQKAPTADQSRQTVEQAIAGRKQIRFPYPDREKKEMKDRTIDPWAVIAQSGLFYVVGRDHARNEPRYFRLDRAGTVEVLSEERDEDPPADLRSMIASSYIRNPLETNEEALIRYQKSAEKNLQRIIKLKSIETDSNTDWNTARCSIRDRAWFREVIRSFGETICILEPEDLRQDLMEDVNNLLHRVKNPD
ncbi:MAG: WYL domain-containing protein [Leptospiraceae bacterium]|nr:WYL domain-containing protein [Leptospiraceae bacterium]